ncbi:hypothetical protein B9Z19DRAFT_1109491 [Tuber borchii]|uniref:Uncharacterized protein n=1 Tax=Tuber borchii TaxID=42251 RepID=A0A2T6ZLN6_TUBBO|nr:hypothetical protein B9Z19DRAFT_1109491 [Tuber borchii]
MSGEGNESMLSSLDGPTPILCRKYASQPASPRDKSAMENSREGLSPPRSLVSVRSMPAILVEQGCLDGYSLEEYIHSLYASYVTPQKAKQSLLLRSPLIAVADSDLILSGREPILGTLIPSRKGGSQAVTESDTSSPPMPLMKDYYGSADEYTSASVSTKSVASEEVTVLDFARTSEPEGDRGFMGARGHLPRASPRVNPLGLGLSLNTDIEKDMNDPDPSFHRAAGSPRGPVREAFIEQVGSAFYFKKLKNDSLGKLPRITPVEWSFPEHESPELTAIQESSPGGGYRSRGPETPSSNSSNETIRPGVRNVVILPGESDRRYHSSCCRRSHGEMDIGSAAGIKIEEGEGIILHHARHRGAIAPGGPSCPPASPTTPAATTFSLLRKEKGSVVLERKPFPPGHGGSNYRGIHPAPPIKTTVLCYANVLPEQSRTPTPVLTIGDNDTSQPNSPSGSGEFSSVRWSRVSVASSMPYASGCTSGLEGSKSLRSIKALLLNEGIQLKEGDARSGNGTPGDRLSRGARLWGTI